MTNIFDLSDEEFMAQEFAQEQQPEAESTEPVQEEDTNSALEASGKDVEAPEEDSEGKTTPEDKEAPIEAPADAANESVEPVNYEELYKKVLAPFKANGRDVTPQNVDEVIKLMQMGANYTRKMQDIAPHRKILTMLQNNELLDEEKLSFLIDLNKKDKVAIQKLLKDSGVDPLDIDVTNEVNYVAGNHRVSNEEVALNSVLDDVLATSTGAETVQVISQQWDQASKEILWKDPHVIEIINQQRSNGIYDKISSEIERQKVLGAVAYDVPFLEAYKVIGQKMNEAGLLSTTATTPVARTSATNTTKVANNEKAKAASTSRSTPNKVNPNSDPLSLSDEEFLKFMAGRV